MKLARDPSVEAFRKEFSGWLEKNRPDPEMMAREPSHSSAHSPQWSRDWARRMFDAGWLVPGWPPELGGRNASPAQTLAYRETLNESGVPRTTNPQGLGIIAPSLIQYGNEAQREAFALPLLRGEMTACLGMSEPDAGSDLASLKTRAVLDGDSFVLNGQKVWTSGAADADFCFLFCRTDPEAAKHAGISIVLVPMDTPGVTVRPLNEIVHKDDPDLSEVFLDNARVPAENLVGELNNGWHMASGSLAHERSMVWLDSVLGIEAAMKTLLARFEGFIENMSRHERTVAIDDVVGLFVETQAVRCLGYRAFSRSEKLGSAPEQALMKAYSSEVRQDLARIASEVAGSRSHAVSGERKQQRADAIGTIEDYFSTFASTISAGSSEIQRNIIAERILGLPKG